MAKQTHNYQQLNVKKQTKQTTRTETESQMWISFGGSSFEGENGGNGAGIKKHNWQEQNLQGGVKNTAGNGEAKEFTCMTHGHELSRQLLEGRGTKWKGTEGKSEDNCKSIINKIYFKII